MVLILRISPRTLFAHWIFVLLRNGHFLSCDGGLLLSCLHFYFSPLRGLGIVCYYLATNLKHIGVLLLLEFCIMVSLSLLDASVKRVCECSWEQTGLRIFSASEQCCFFCWICLLLRISFICSDCWFDGRKFQFFDNNFCFFFVCILLLIPLNIIWHNLSLLELIF